MSMSEFERQQNSAEDDVLNLSMETLGIPDDFSVDDLAFARELDALFDLGREEIPPYFVQTLLEPNDPRLQTVEAEFEAKTRARVLRRLKLPRHLFRSNALPWQSLRSMLPTRRPVSAIIITTLLIMVLSMVYTAPAFASGLFTLLAGPHSGVLQVHDYPGALAETQHANQSAVRTRARHIKSDQRISLLEATRMLHFAMYWPQPSVMPSSYTLDDVYVYSGQHQIWADGPILELDYDYALPGVAPHGSGRIAICEFKPMGKVLQVVQLGSAHELKIDAHGNATALYVNGQWTSINKSSHVWEYSGRNELIYERDGVIFWIVGYQSDGVSNSTLTTIASSLGVFNTTYAMRMKHVIDNVMQSQSNAPLWLAGDVIYLDNPDKPDGPTLRVVGEDSSETVRQSTLPLRRFGGGSSFPH